ncbi:LysM peptidoglycan-binding domain-containing protein [Hydrotalea sp.]|uniref:LysM peptidoglycan-binding domain-containing protein n=1 Tax=Hydrotalea sp. TaxID=2881279 RepID=UPI003D0FBA1A
MTVTSVFKASIFSFSMLLFVSLKAQTGSTIVHVIKHGETLSGLAHQYHTTVGDIMRLNGMNSKSVLRIGEKVKIPVKGDKVTAANTANKITAPQATQNLQPQNNTQPIMHVVGPKETLYAISRKYKVTVAQIQEWNHLTSTNIHTGQQLSIGASTTTPIATNTLSITNEPVNTVNNASALPAQTKPTPTQVATSDNTNKVSNPSTQNVSNNAINSAASTTSQKEVTNVSNTSVSADDVPVTGFFTEYYKQSGQSIVGNASVFKTASGWMDKKYYVLINNIPEGTIVKIESNQKVVYAKVLGALPNIKEDNGLLLRLSNAAASVLGMADKTFPVTVQY